MKENKLQKYQNPIDKDWRIQMKRVGKSMDGPIGRVLELLPSRDGEVRAARFKTAEGDLIRPLQQSFTPWSRREFPITNHPGLKTGIGTRIGRTI